MGSANCTGDMMRETTSRRNLLIALAGFTATAVAAPALQVVPSHAEILLPVPIRSRPSDPIYAAMERYIRLDQIHVSLSDSDFGAAAALDAYRARRMLAQTAPISREGLAAL